VHLNTVARPPAEKDARPVPYARLVRLAGRFSEPADVVVDVAESVHRAVAEAPQAAPRPLMPEPEA
jgi:hypothetical protein